MPITGESLRVFPLVMTLAQPDWRMMRLMDMRAAVAVVALIVASGCSSTSGPQSGAAPIPGTPAPTASPAVADGGYYGRILPSDLTPTSFRFVIECRVDSHTTSRPRAVTTVTLHTPANIERVIWFAPNGDFSKGHGQDADFALWVSTVRHPEPREGLMGSWYVGVRNGAVYWLAEEIPLSETPNPNPCRGNGDAPPS